MRDDDDAEQTMTISASQFAPAGVPRLLVFGAAGKQAVPLRKGPLVVGRSEDADVQIEDASLSRAHARVSLEGGGLAVEDLGSRNGTTVGARRLSPKERVVVAAGEPFGCGKIVLVLDVPAQERKAPPSSSPKPGGADRLEALVKLVAESDISVVLHGETGVGKEVTVRAIHEASARKAKPFIGINCAALPESLLESELFGYERGAFSGAQTAKPGLFEAADGGTVFLDEIGDMSPAMQAKLLRVLEERQVTRLGSVKPKSIDVRFVAASHRSLDAEVAAGRFREDLFFRINGITLSIPPLRERGPAEIERLARLFVAKSGKDKRLSDAALAALCAHPWPGNVRELRNAVERAVVLSAHSPAIEPEHLALSAPPASSSSKKAAPAGAGADDEKARIIAALDATAGNQSRAAELLGISRRTLVNKIIAHGVARPRKT